MALGKTAIGGLPVVALVALVAIGCGDSASHVDCGRGRLVLADGAQYCAYAAAIVIEGGFQCPMELPYEILLGGGAAVCAGEQQEATSLPPVVCASLESDCAPALDAGTPPSPADSGVRVDSGLDAGVSDTGAPSDSGPADSGVVDSSAADSGGPTCSVAPGIDCLFVSHLDGTEPGALADGCGPFVVTPTAGVATAPGPSCGGALAFPYTDGGSGLGPGFGTDGIDLSGSDALSLDVNPVLTIEALVYALEVDPSGPTSGPKPTVLRQTDGQYRVFVYDGRIGAVLGNLCGPFLGYRWALDPDPLPLARWVHVLAVIDRAADRVELYVDGVLKAMADAGPCTPPGTSTGGARIGNSSANDVFTGYLDEVMIRRGAHRP